VLFSEDYRENQARLVPDTLIVAEGSVALDDYAGGIRMRAQRILTLDEARAEWARVLDLSLASLRSEQVRSLHQVITQCPSGSCRLRMRYQREDAWVELQLPDNWQLRPDEQLLRRLNDTLGPDSRVTLVYGSPRVETAPDASAS
jgi:DNA polymerase III subunit alpha